MITRNEVSEARTYAKLENPTEWQKRRIISLYLSLTLSASIKLSPDFNKDFFDQIYKDALNHFKNN